MKTVSIGLIAVTLFILLMVSSFGTASLAGLALWMGGFATSEVVAYCMRTQAAKEKRAI